jgi:hypothetical protein
MGFLKNRDFDYMSVVSPPYGDLINFRSWYKKYPKITHLDAKSARKSPMLGTDDEIRRSFRWTIEHSRTF